MPQEIIHVRVRNLPVKILLIVLLLFASVWSYYVVRWYLGNTLAEYFNPAQSSMNVAQMAVSMAPDDPLTHWRVAQVVQKNLPLDQQGPAIVEYEKAVSLSPNDYRLWMSLGTAHEQAGDPVKAEQALRRAVALAPAYAYPHWYLGNLLLRNGRYDEAFAELRIASEAEAEFRSQQFSLIWEIYNDDPAALRNAIGESSAARASFAFYLLGQKRFDEGLGLWSSLSADEKRANKATAESIVTTLKNELRFHNALQVWNDSTTEKYHAAVGRVFDGSFEEAVTSGPGTVFGWQVRSAPHTNIGIDPSRSHSGERSLKLIFQVRSNLEAIDVGQLVPVQPGTEYEVECYVATDKLETGSAPQVHVIDATNGAVLAASQMAPTGTNDWTRVSFTFKAGDKTEAVNLKVVRLSCGTEEAPVCPIFGSVWYDDFTFKPRN